MPSDIVLYTVGIPIIAGLLCLALPDRLKILLKALTFLVTLASLAASIYIFIHKPLSWQAGFTTVFSVDNLSAFTGLGVAVFAFLIAIYSFGFVERSFGSFFGCFLMTLGGSFGAAFANDLIALLVFWSMLAVTLYLLVNMQGTDAAASSAKKALIIIGGTDAVMIFGAGLIWMLTGTFAMDRIHLPLTGAASVMAYISIAIASFAKAGAIPVHSWVPDVAEDAPTPVAAYLPASLDKLLGIYLLVRASTELFVMNRVSNIALMALGSVTIIYAVLMALVQHDFKRLLGYHAVSQVGYMVLGIGTGSPIGIAGGVFHMLNNALYKSCLFLTSGAVEKKAGTTDLARLGGLSVRMPVTFAACLVSALAISGVPPLNGFVSKWMIYQAVLEAPRRGGALWILWLAAAMLGSALTLASFMKLLHTAFLGRASEGFEDIKEAGFSLTLPMVVLAATCVIFGVFAFSIPLSLFIIPSVGKAVTYIGLWSPAAATALIAVGIVLGLLIYYLSRPGAFRTVDGFVGGEEADSLERMSGVEFYDTIREMKALGPIYRGEESRSFDIYVLSSRVVSIFTRFFQYLHNGILPTYLVWCLLGMTAMFLVFFLR